MHICNHELTAIRWRNKSVGLIGRQCIECKRRVGDWIKHSEIQSIEAIGEWDWSAEAPANDNREEVVSLRGDKKFVDRAAYQEYLTSETWKRRRSKVMARANGICEGCLSQPATEVHHLTYAHIYNELAFELVALCEACHRRAHHADDRVAA